MRKRLIIGAIAVVVIGAVACAAWRLGYRGVEYHTRNYWSGFYGTNRLDLLRLRVMALARRPVTQGAYVRSGGKLTGGGGRVG